MVSKLIKDAVELWNVFEKNANFRDEVYDKVLLEKIREELKLPSTDSITNLLKNSSISVEELLVAVINTLEPFSLMMNDLLKMFETAGAKKSDNNILINFNFENNENTFAFDLNSFRESISIVNKVSKFIDTFKIKDPWKMVYYLGGPDRFLYDKSYDIPEDITNWIYEYQEKDVFPNFIPNVPKTNIESIDKKLKILWLIYRLAIEEYRKVYNEKEGRQKSHYAECCKRANDQFWQAETDYWTCSLIKEVALNVCEINSLNGLDRQNKIEQFDKSLNKCISLIDIEQEEIELQVESIIEMLNLPVWKKRYEMYSVWTATQIIEALEDFDAEFNVVNDSLSFSFTGSKIAVCKKLNPPLEIWAELRTYYDSPISKKRKSHIQPDYTLSINDISVPENSVLVIECKQYKKYSLKNFTEAVIDYANGRPNADIILNNYTNIPKKIYDNIHENIRKRISFFSNMRPNNAEGFKKSIKESVVSYYTRNYSLKNIFLFNPSDLNLPFEIKLKWGQIPKDLDLYLKIEGPGIELSPIYYSNLGSKNDVPYSFLNKDCRNGYGEEIITINKFMNGIYDIYVNNFSGECTVSDIIEVCISDGNTCMKLYRKDSIDKSSVWHVLTISKSGIKIIDKIESKSNGTIRI